MILRTTGKKNRELQYALKKRDKCKTEFKETASKANGYLKSKIKEGHPAFADLDRD